MLLQTFKMQYLVLKLMLIKADNREPINLRFGFKSMRVLLLLVFKGSRAHIKKFENLRMLVKLKFLKVGLLLVADEIRSGRRVLPECGDIQSSISG